jgi:solute carrier family 25 protein 39/40
MDDCGRFVISVHRDLLNAVKTSSFTKQFLASFASGSVAALLLNPITVIKVNIQNSHDTTFRSVVKRIVQDRGIRGFWAGTSTAIVQIVPSNVTYMAVYEYFKTYLAQYPGSTGLAGALGRFVAVSFMTPVELIRTIQNGGSRESPMNIVRNIIRVEGYGGLYRGWRSSILRDVPFSALYWLSFENIKLFGHSLHANAGDSFEPFKGYFSKNSSGLTFIAGSCAGMIAAIATHPYDVLKTQQQLARPIGMQACQHLEGNSSFKYKRKGKSLLANKPILDRGVKLGNDR